MCVLYLHVFQIHASPEGSHSDELRVVDTYIVSPGENTSLPKHPPNCYQNPSTHLLPQPSLTFSFLLMTCLNSLANLPTLPIFCPLSNSMGCPQFIYVGFCNTYSCELAFVFASSWVIMTQGMAVCATSSVIPNDTQFNILHN